MFSKAALVATLAGCALAQDYSTSLGSVIAASANSGKFVVATANTIASLIQASTTTGKDLAAVGTHLSTTISTACQDAYHARATYHVSLDRKMLHDMNFLYAFKYIAAGEYDDHIAAVKACLTADAPSGLTQMKTDLDTAKSSIVRYVGKLDFDWTAMMDDLNTGTTAIALTSAQQADYYNSYLIMAAHGCGEQYLGNDHGSNTPYYASTVFTAVALDSAAIIVEINKLDSAWNFADWMAWTEYTSEEFRKKPVGFDQYVQ
jgi:hypothetical protein